MVKKQNSDMNPLQKYEAEISQIIQKMCETKTEDAIRMGAYKLSKKVIEIAEWDLEENRNSINGAEILLLVSNAAGI